MDNLTNNPREIQKVPDEKGNWKDVAYIINNVWRCFLKDLRNYISYVGEM